MANLIPDAGGDTGVERLEDNVLLSSDLINQQNQSLINKTSGIGGKVYISSKQQLSTITTEMSFDHGLGKIPNLISIIIECISGTAADNLGYQPGYKYIISNPQYNITYIATNTQIKKVYVNSSNFDFSRVSSTYRVPSFSLLKQDNFRWYIMALAI